MGVDGDTKPIPTDDTASEQEQTKTARITKELIKTARMTENPIKAAKVTKKPTKTTKITKIVEPEPEPMMDTSPDADRPITEPVDGGSSPTGDDTDAHHLKNGESSPMVEPVIVVPVGEEQDIATVPISVTECATPLPARSTWCCVPRRARRSFAWPVPCP